MIIDPAAQTAVRRSDLKTGGNAFLPSNLQKVEHPVDSSALKQLHASSYSISLRHVSCQCSERTLILRGSVPSFYLKQIAQTLVLGMEGVDLILNQLEVIK
jgi:osmotically-inducible protein OsmY